MKGSGLNGEVVVVMEKINNQDLRKLLDLLFLIPTLPLIYPFPFPGPSDGPPLFPELPSLHSPALEIPKENSPPSDHVSQRS